MLSLETKDYVAIAVVLISFLVVYYRQDAIFGKVRLSPSIPRSSKVPILMNGIDVMMHWDNLHAYLLERSRQFNFKNVSMNIPFQEPWIMTCDPKNIEYYMKTNFYNYGKGQQFKDNLEDVLGHGIFAIDGDAWKVIRKTTSNIFNTKSFKLFVEKVFVDEMVVFGQKLEGFAKAGQEFDLQDLFFRFTLDSFGLIGFGVDISSMRQNESKVPFAVAFDRLQTRAFYRFVNPFWKITEALFPGTKHQDLHTMNSFGNKLVKERREEPEEIRSQRSDLLTLFMNARNEHGKPYNDQELTEHVMNLIIAGRDTTAQSLSWTIYYLFQNPEKLDLLLKEINETLGSQMVPDYEQVKNMKYANAVFHEAIRLSPAVPVNIVTCFNDDVLPDGTPVPKGAKVVNSPYVMARCKEIWGEDAESFVPERWLGAKQPSQFEFVSFKCGPRICLGKSFAELEGVFVLVSFLRRFKYELTSLETVKAASSLTHPMKYGLKCKVSLRE
ncbi:cytochrome P450 [Gorgonomyces haynaldii]|nr:cytochrome P450 [Gorgonomyces haynaldii]